MIYKFIDTKKLLDWFSKNKRDLPWRKTKNPYHIWISEVMLQQTQVSTVIPYYERFLMKFPTIESLAKAESTELMKAWEGLGYYSRVRNLQTAAISILREHGGKLPTSQSELSKLKGFGAYTSASVASIAFGEDCAAIDGNVIRVFTRIYSIRDDIRLTKTKSKIEKHAKNNLPKGKAALYNEALMELGATICTPKNPKCDLCPLKESCKAYFNRDVSKFPFKSQKPAVPHFEIAIGVIHKNNKVLIALRPKEGLLGNLWEFPGGKLKKGESLQMCCKREIEEETGLKVTIGERIAIVKHAYTHFKITLHAFHCKYVSGKAIPKTSQEIRWVDVSEISNYAFPKANHTIISKLLHAEPEKLSLF